MSFLITFLGHVCVASAEFIFFLLTRCPGILYPTDPRARAFPLPNAPVKCRNKSLGWPQREHFKLRIIASLSRENCDFYFFCTAFLCFFLAGMHSHQTMEKVFCGRTSFFSFPFSWKSGCTNTPLDSLLVSLPFYFILSSLHITS